MFHNLLKVWFLFVLDWRYAGVALLMALESTVFPIPSEIIIPPAAYWASLGKMHFWGVVAAGMIGSYIGSAISYWVSQWLGRPFLLKFGKYFFLPAEKLIFAEKWAVNYAGPGIFLARMLPVARHVVSIPAGILKMPFWKFSLATLVGSGGWCAVLAWFGAKVIGDQPTLLQEPAVLVHVLKAKLIYFVGAILVFGFLYFYIHCQMKQASRT
ncbi:MAG: hypothetical protein A3F82_03630 [Deltaproteobacteria bacterium RIFCSPLOWO2_12_FULL_44_12]|nr:MAG: hypothetical protein A2712_05600 [Deltaproteobacteria bacterium RIFCSPHIGHO2_01_FULL_43_49]OGQ14323.1 MAG: hypothetical protein A3D22_04785 [Deltaproteobacteria bacterium RIFCSPHIGHO2_02_FULL_44_53]OGQ27637.1 MAG: hypothetical protein A3D98_09390 [Deltaproteobacteria bacterium RIFCSPHIGHO2_12_FULL_44_21]OGQ30764.1 MAG: hypothetical protein A2979_01195 [Deltaproteobacteria bacterium RIFCSPLOWO2_01_FULL_45_74]OGQ42444.1 MAG: hypothetical protein A3I70_10720 [Deltaproteobacteria bacterium 